MRPFKTPLYEVSTELITAHQDVADFRAHSFYDAIKAELPAFQQYPLLLVDPRMQGPGINPTPAIYRFVGSEGNRFVSIGPRILAVNRLRWNGYPEYRDFVARIAGLYLDFCTVSPVERFSIGFYNRVPVTDLAELREIIANMPPFPPGMLIEAFTFQFTRHLDLGLVVTQLMMRPPDQFTPEPFLAINNIIRRDNVTGFDLSNWLPWLDAAHEAAKRLLWETLTTEAQESWKAANAS